VDEYENADELLPLFPTTEVADAVIAAPPPPTVIAYWVPGVTEIELIFLTPPAPPPPASPVVLPVAFPPDPPPAIIKTSTVSGDTIPTFAVVYLGNPLVIDELLNLVIAIVVTLFVN
jgi:hypothetical protein